MKLLQLCVVAAIAAGVTTGPHIARAQALGEAATLNAGVSSAGSASGSALGNTIGRVLKGEGGRLASSSKTSTSGGVVNMHWSQKQLERPARTTGTQTTTRTQTKGNAKVGSEKAQPDFVILGGDSSDASSGDASASQPKPAKGSSGDKDSPGQGARN